jgi:1-acyl-sn-glycerol-3-phosphate acyltransferase
MASAGKTQGHPRPPDYIPPPRAPLSAAARTALVAFTDLLPSIVRMAVTGNAPTSATEQGLAAIRANFRRALARLGVELSVLHVDRVPMSGGLLFFWNQESHLDHLALPSAIPRPFVSLYNNEIASLPFYGEHMRRTGHLHVDRTDEAQWRASVAAAAARAREGTCILVSPEGTRSWDGELLPMKRGALQLATSAAVPLVCVTVIGGHERMPRGSPFVRPGPLRVVFSEPIATAGESEARLQDILVETFRGTKARYRV